MSPEVKDMAAKETVGLRRRMDLAEIRRAHKLSQEELAKTLNVGQASIAKLEKRTDMYFSSLRRFIEAMGGKLEIVARFPDHQVSISNFDDLTKDEPEHPKGVTAG